MYVLARSHGRGGRHQVDDDEAAVTGLDQNAHRSEPPAISEFRCHACCSWAINSAQPQTVLGRDRRDVRITILDGRDDLVGDVLSYEVAFWDMALA